MYVVSLSEDYDEIRSKIGRALVVAKTEKDADDFTADVMDTELPHEVYGKGQLVEVGDLDALDGTHYEWVSCTHDACPCFCQELPVKNEGHSSAYIYVQDVPIPVVAVNEDGVMRPKPHNLCIYRVDVV